MTMFEMIDELEPIIPESEMNALHATAHHIWKKDNPEAHKEIVRRYNAKRGTKKKGERNECDVADCR